MFIQSSVYYYAMAYAAILPVALIAAAIARDIIRDHKAR